MSTSGEGLYLLVLPINNTCSSSCNNFLSYFKHTNTAIKRGPSDKTTNHFPNFVTLYTCNILWANLLYSSWTTTNKSVFVNFWVRTAPVITPKMKKLLRKRFTCKFCCRNLSLISFTRRTNHILLLHFKNPHLSNNS